MNNKKTTVITISAILALILLVATATYAYFQADLGNNKEVDVTVSTVPQTDLLSFTVGDPISLQADNTSFVKGGDSVSDTTNVKALLTAGKGGGIKYYYIYLLIPINEFIYTQDENTPELILTITKPDGTELTTLDGLTYKTVTDGKGTIIKGFDITTKKGLITIANNRKITAKFTVEEQWNVTITLVNYNVNQSYNLAKTFKSKLIIQQDKIVPSPATFCSSDQSLDSCVVSLNGFVDTLYYHDNNLNNGAGDNSYRFAGASDSVNNYICLGSEEANCPDANLFRIIGVFGDQTKVIRAKSVGDKEWHTSESNTWSSSSLNTYLNGEYLTSLGTIAKKIATTTWKVGGNTWENIGTAIPSVAYQYEVGSNASTTTVDKKIGLMYVSDYGFAADQSAWTTKLDSYASNVSNIWLILGNSEWTISPVSDGTGTAFSLFGGNVSKVNLVTFSLAVRPTFSLLPSVTYASGDGTLNSPIRIN